MSARWHILTAEYPPQPGGVSDYTRHLALALSRGGDRVDLWAPDAGSPELDSGGVTIHRLAWPFSPGGLDRLGRALPDGRDSILLVQYVPSAFGYRAMNVPFALWLARRPERLWMMFHEVTYPVGLRVPLAHTARGLVNRAMAALVLRRTEQAFVSTSAWTPLVERLGGRGRVSVLPIPSNLPDHADPAAVVAARAASAAPGEVLIGHFGTYGPLLSPLLLGALPPLLEADPRRRAALVGRGSDRFLARLLEVAPALRGRVSASGPVDEAEVAARLSACDVLVQPFPDGATTRRTSLMAGLSLGKPVVTCAGHLCEPFWASSGAVALAAAPRPAEIAAAAEALLRTPDRWAPLGERARRLYAERFSMDRTVATLRAARGVAP